VITVNAGNVITVPREKNGDLGSDQAA